MNIHDLQTRVVMSFTFLHPNIHGHYLNLLGYLMSRHNTGLGIALPYLQLIALATGSVGEGLLYTGQPTAVDQLQMVVSP
jgi:hypothetical protein